MTSAGVIAFLRDLNYENSNRLRPAQFNVVLNDRHLRRFFEFLLTNIKKERNFVTDEELKRFNQLKSDGRVILDAEERQRLMQTAETGSKSAGDDDDDGKSQSELHNNQLEAARARLENLKQLEQRLAELYRQQLEKENKTAHKQTQLAVQHRSDLKQLQIQSIGIDMQFRDSSKRLAEILHRFRCVAYDPSALRSIFFSAFAVCECVSSVKEALLKFCSTRERFLEKSRNASSISWCSSDTSDGDEFHRLRDAFAVTLLEKFTEEMRMADVKARVKCLPTLKGRLENVHVDEDFLRLTADEDSVTITSMREKIQSIVESTLTQEAATDAEVEIIKARRSQYRWSIERANFLIAKEDQALVDLRRQMKRIEALKLLILEEQSLLKDKGTQQVNRIKCILQDRLEWISECQDELNKIIANKTTFTVSASGKERHTAEAGVPSVVIHDDLRRAGTILELSRWHDQIQMLYKSIATGVPEFNEAVDKYDRQLTTMEKMLLNCMRQYEAGKST